MLTTRLFSYIPPEFQSGSHRYLIVPQCNQHPVMDIGRGPTWNDNVRDTVNSATSIIEVVTPDSLDIIDPFFRQRGVMLVSST